MHSNSTNAQTSLQLLALPSSQKKGGSSAPLGHHFSGLSCFLITSSSRFNWWCPHLRHQASCPKTSVPAAANSIESQWWPCTPGVLCTCRRPDHWTRTWGCMAWARRAFPAPWRNDERLENNMDYLVNSHEQTKVKVEEKPYGWCVPIQMYWELDF